MCGTVGESWGEEANVRGHVSENFVADDVESNITCDRSICNDAIASEVFTASVSMLRRMISDT